VRRDKAALSSGCKPVTDPIELAELFDVDVDDFARTSAFTAAHWLGWLQRRQAVEPQSFQDAATPPSAGRPLLLCA
jgi:hypothetical protein